MKLFGRKLKPGLSIGAQKDFAANFNKMMAILENMEGVGGITITKRGDYFRFSLTGESDAAASSGGGLPSGYEEETVQTPWELTIDGDTATCVNCMLMLSTVTVMAAGGQMQLTCDLTGHTDGWLCGVIKGSTKEVSLDFREPTTEMNEEQDEIVFPLYRVIKEDGVWRVVVDARSMPRIGAYW